MGDVRSFLSDAKTESKDTARLLDGNIQQLMSTRSATSAAQYFATPTHPAFDRFAFFYFMVMFHNTTKVNFRERYLFLGDEITSPEALWRLVAKRPYTTSLSPFAPIVIVYGPTICVRFAHRMYVCSTLVQAAVLWCHLVQRHLYVNEGLATRVLEDGTDIAPFLAFVFPLSGKRKLAGQKRKYPSSTAAAADDDDEDAEGDTRPHLLHEMEHYKYDDSDLESDDKTRIARRNQLVAATSTATSLPLAMAAAAAAARAKPGAAAVAKRPGAAALRQRPPPPPPPPSLSSTESDSDHDMKTPSFNAKRRRSRLAIRSARSRAVPLSELRQPPQSPQLSD
jgi:hypothetical protein